MKQLKVALRISALFAIALTSHSSHAFFHLWRFSEFFSSSDGEVQFIEMTTANSGPFANNEIFAEGATITSQSTGKVFTFPNNLTGSTLNKSLLIATTGFGSLPGGVTPNFVLPSTDFFNPAGDTITLFSSFTIDQKPFSSVPTDGVMSLNFPSNTLVTNSPTNFAGTSGSVNIPPPPTTTGDYNGNQTVDAADYTVWRDTLGQSASPHGSGADGDGDGTISSGDYDFWKSKFGTVLPGAGGGSSVATGAPEPTVLSLALLGVAALIFAVSPIRSNRRKL